MALTDSEVWRIRYELGYHIITVDAEPYISYVSLFEQVIQPYVTGGASTTSTTAVTAASPAAPASLTLVSATGFATGNRVSVDVDSRQETATLQDLSGTTATMLLSKAHSGTYPVTVEGGESIIREILSRIADVKSRMATTFGYGALKKVDEIEFYNSGGSYFGALGDQLTYWRDELASALGVASMWSHKRAAAQQLANH